MAPTKQKGDIAELRIASDLARQGYRIAFPYGEDCSFDLVLIRDDDRFERVQVKYSRSNGEVVTVRCRTHSLTNGKVRSVTHYTDQMIDWLAVYDPTSDRCFYVPSSELGAGRSMLHLRLTKPRNNQRLGIRHAEDYTEIPDRKWS